MTTTMTTQFAHQTINLWYIIIPLFNFTTYSVKCFKMALLKHPLQIIIGHLNINYIRSKFDILKPMPMHKIDIFLVAETKSDDSFPVSQVNVEGFSSPFTLDRNKNGRGTILYIRNYIIASNLTRFRFSNDRKTFF